MDSIDSRWNMTTIGLRKTRISTTQRHHCRVQSTLRNSEINWGIPKKTENSRKLQVIPKKNYVGLRRNPSNFEELWRIQRSLWEFSWAQFLQIYYQYWRIPRKSEKVQGDSKKFYWAFERYPKGFEQISVELPVIP